MNISVSTCEKYREQTIPYFTRFFERYWAGQAFTVFSDDRAPRVAWSDVLIQYLKTLSEPATVLLLDDYLLCDRVDARQVQRCWDTLLEHPEVGFVRLNPCPGPERCYDDLLGKFCYRANYLVSLQPCIWRVECLLDLLRPGESAWDFEIRGTPRAQLSSWLFLGTRANLVSVQNLMRQGVPQADVLQWIKEQG